ncbi:MAG: LCP family protein [Clostridia bacterium]|nr:LCP family protein [Clostridia bacterium]
MNIRKFALLTSTVVMIFLFATGIFVLNYLSSSTVSAAKTGNKNVLGGILEGIKEIQEPVNILVLGGDKVNGNTDTIMLVNYDPSSTKVNVISIPRDTKVYIEEKERKINFAYPHGGAKLAVETVSGLLQANIKYFVYIDTSVFRKIIDKLGGIEDFYVPQDLNYDDDAQNLHIHLKKGLQDLDGDKAEQYMRYRGYGRKATEFYDGSDIKRIDAQQNLIKELIKQKANMFYIHKFNDVVTDIFDSLETNMMLSKLIGLAQNIGSFKSENVSFYTLPGSSKYSNGVSYFIHEEEKTKDIISQFFSASEGFDGSEQVIGNYSKYVEDMTKKNNSESTNSIPKKKKSYTKNNPSNKDTNIKKNQKPAP